MRQAFYKRCVAEIHQTKKDESVLGFVKEQDDAPSLWGLVDQVFTCSKRC